MAEDSDQERTEEPTGKRLDDARKKGQVARSRELSVFMMTIGGACGLLFMGQDIANGLMGIMRQEFSLEREELFDPAFLLSHFYGAVESAIWMLFPFMGLMVILAIVGPLSMGGWIFSWEALKPKWSKLNLVESIPRLFAWRGLLELVKSLIKFLLVSLSAWTLFNLREAQYLSLNREPLLPALEHVMALLGESFIIISATLILLAAIDVPFQLWDNKRKLKMTLQEVKDEMKESNGRPEVKGRIRRMQMEMARGRMMEKVPEADVIVTNPTHYAVALQYEPGSPGAPRVIAKGSDLIAAQIRNLANGAQVPIVSAPPLARAIYFSTDIDHEIPSGLYLAVAQVLAYVYQLKASKTRSYQSSVMTMNDLPIPEEFLRPEKG